MNVHDGLVQIKDRLIERDAKPETLALVDVMIDRAATPGAERAQASMTQLVRMLARTPAANSNIGIYDDLVQLQDEMELQSAQRAAELDAEAARPLPKSRKYYRQLKEREKKQAEENVSS